jgi:hypothetical protein
MMMMMMMMVVVVCMVLCVMGEGGEVGRWMLGSVCDSVSPPMCCFAL